MFLKWENLTLLFLQNLIQFGQFDNNTWTWQKAEIIAWNWKKGNQKCTQGKTGKTFVLFFPKWSISYHYNYIHITVEFKTEKKRKWLIFFFFCFFHRKLLSLVFGELYVVLCVASRNYHPFLLEVFLFLQAGWFCHFIAWFLFSFCFLESKKCRFWRFWWKFKIQETFQYFLVRLLERSSQYLS